MALSQFYHLVSMEKTSSDRKHQPLPVLALVDFLLFHALLGLARVIRRLFCVFLCFIRSQLTVNSKDQKQNPDFDLFDLQKPAELMQESEHLRRDEVEAVMGSLQLFCSLGGDEKFEERLGFEEFSRLFEEEPSFEEVKGAFDVFDTNRDGFIDAVELRRVLCILGIKEGAQLELCRKMIRPFDENCDGRIEFHEFLKLIEKSFC